MKRRLIVGLLMGTTLLGGGFLSACGDGGNGKDGQSGTGTLSFALATQGPSGSTYRLRDAVFEISNSYWYSGYGGEGGVSSHSYTVSSEDDPDANSINVSVEQGYYNVHLLPGWRMEKADASGTSEVEATLLTGNDQWVWVEPHSTSWVEFSFGIGGREVWLNGDLNIGVNVYEDPAQYYGGWAGQPGDFEPGAAGAGG